ncbi:MAG: acetyl-CoA decarbonylase/synthase complex subunit delta [Nitrospirota bacterium]
MSYVVPKETYSGKVYTLQFGSGNKTITVGGENALPFLTFEGVIPHKPAIAIEIQDTPPADWPETLQKVFEGVSGDPIGWAKYCQDTLKAEAIALRLISTHPDRENRSPGEAAKTVKDVLDAITVPLIILGSNHVEKDSQVLVATAEVAKGKNSVIGKAQEGNYKTIAAAAMANDLKLIAMSELDINLCKQLNILLSQLGFDKEKILTDPMCSALGYGLEYTYSVMERIRAAAITQNDPTMQPPIIADIGMYVWKIKETVVSEVELPHWGSTVERGIAWEVITAVSMIMAGAELLIMRHPKAVEGVKKVIEELA